MHAEPPTEHPAHGNGANVNETVATATTAVAAAVAPPVSRGARRHAQRLQKAQALAQRSAHRTTGRPMSGTASGVRVVIWALVALAVLGIGAVVTGAVQLGPGTDTPLERAAGKAGGADDTWSYYHDTDYSTQDTGAKWSTDRTRSTDPDASPLGDTTRWDYEGPYKYGGYGTDGAERRKLGQETTDPIYSEPQPLQDVFSHYGGNLDPSGGQPVGVAPSSMTTPYYDPYAGYANPYANRIRMSYGEGVGRGASYQP
jgi:hypothetical protein